MTCEASAQPAANESYCVGVNPENCPYAWTQEQGRWRFNPTIAESGSSFETPSDYRDPDRVFSSGRRGMRHREHVWLPTENGKR
jgi:hypothetical protein